MVQFIDVRDCPTLEDYASYTYLQSAVEQLRRTARDLAPALRGRTVWMVNSTSTGGGVAEMLPRMVSLLCQLGVRTRWAVIESDEPHFFELTKRLHNMIHGAEGEEPSTRERSLYEAVSRKNADALASQVAQDDVLVVHDPQPLGTGAELRRRVDVRCIWRCHVGSERESEAARRAWGFLEPWTRPYERAVFSVEEYVPSFLWDRRVLIPPAIDPLSHKNRELSVNKLSGILSNASLVTTSHPTITPPFRRSAQRLQRGGAFASATSPEDIGLLFRPIVTQVSRWDRLKGYGPLLQAFAHLKRHKQKWGDRISERHRARLDAARLVLAGADPRGVHDDPEAEAALAELGELWRSLAPPIQRDVAILLLPMESVKENALMVNALQRCSTVAVQNSLREGFGLTVTEAMWKGLPVVGSGTAGIRAQMDDRVHGRLVEDPSDPEEVALVLDEVLRDPMDCVTWGRNAQRRVGEEFLVLSQVARWLRVLAS